LDLHVSSFSLEIAILGAKFVVRRSQNFFAPPQTPPGGVGRPKFNQLEMITTFTYRPSLAKIDARNFELSW